MTVPNADLVKSGDPDPTGGGVRCDRHWSDNYGYWTCTRAAGHPGQHVAGNSVTVQAVLAADNHSDVASDWRVLRHGQDISLLVERGPRGWTGGTLSSTAARQLAAELLQAAKFAEAEQETSR